MKKVMFTFYGFFALVGEGISSVKAASNPADLDVDFCDNNRAETQALASMRRYDNYFTVLQSEALTDLRSGRVEAFSKIRDQMERLSSDTICASNQKAKAVYALDEAERKYSEKRESLAERERAKITYLEKRAKRQKRIVEDFSDDQINTRYLQLLFLAEPIPAVRNARTIEDLLSLPSLTLVEELSNLKQEFQEANRDLFIKAQTQKKLDDLLKEEKKFYKKCGVHLQGVVVEPAIEILRRIVIAKQIVEVFTRWMYSRVVFVEPEFERCRRGLTWFESKREEFNTSRDGENKWKISLSDYRKSVTESYLFRKIKSLIQTLGEPSLIREATLSLDKITSAVSKWSNFFDKISIIIPWIENKGEAARYQWLMGSFVESARAFPGDEDPVGCVEGICESMVLGLSGIDPQFLDPTLLAVTRKLSFVNHINQVNPQLVRNFLHMTDVQVECNDAEVYKTKQRKAKEDWINIHKQALNDVCQNGIINTINTQLAQYRISSIKQENEYLDKWKGFMIERIEISAEIIDWEEVLTTQPADFRSFDSEGNLVVQSIFQLTGQ